MNLDGRMNSKDEFLQGSNIYMQPVRDFEVWGQCGWRGETITPGEVREGGTEALTLEEY